MPKITFTQEQQLDLTKRLQLLLLDAMMATGSWGRDDLRFQGGTSLSLVYGSPRFSEDLDFIVGTTKGLQRMLGATGARLSDGLRTLLPGAQVKLAARDVDLEVLDARNPRTFTVSVTHPDWYRVIKIKVEFWLADPAAVKQYESGVRTASVMTAVADGSPLRASIAPVLVSVADLEEIVVDKLHALVCRPYMKYRDVFDLWWLRHQGQDEWAQALSDRYENHALMYSDSPALSDMGAKLLEKSGVIAAMAGQREFADDLAKWLGRSSLSSVQSADAMATEVAASLRVCAEQLQALQNEGEGDGHRPRSIP